MSQHEEVFKVCPSANEKVVRVEKPCPEQTEIVCDDTELKKCRAELARPIEPHMEWPDDIEGIEIDE